jgi:hypothetical protein
MDPKYIEILIWSVLGSSLGSAWRAITRPEPSAWRWFFQAFMSLSVGILLGGAIIQHLSLHGYEAAGVCSVCAYLSEEVLRFFQSRGKKLGAGKIDLTMDGDE